MTQHFRSAPCEGPGQHQGDQRGVARSAPAAAYNRARRLMRHQSGVAAGLPRRAK